MVLFPLLLGLLYWVFAAFPDIWWLVAGGGAALVSVIFVTLFPVIIAPIFNKYDPIEDQSLVSQLTEILEKAGLKPGGFFRQDMSRQTFIYQFINRIHNLLAAVSNFVWR